MGAGNCPAALQEQRIFLTLEPSSQSLMLSVLSYKSEQGLALLVERWGWPTGATQHREGQTDSCCGCGPESGASLQMIMDC